MSPARRPRHLLGQRQPDRAQEHLAPSLPPGNRQGGLAGLDSADAAHQARGSEGRPEDQLARGGG
eukprot:6503626-Pyramimonas_sp.AAC.1